MNNYYFYLVRVGDIVISGVLTSKHPPDKAFRNLKLYTFNDFPQYKKTEFLFEKFELMPFNQNLTPTAI